MKSNATLQFNPEEHGNLEQKLVPQGDVNKFFNVAKSAVKIEIDDKTHHNSLCHRLLSVNSFILKARNQ